MTARQQRGGDIEPNEAIAAENKDFNFSIRTHRGGLLTAK
jgi:hypothetical protein